MKRIILLPFLTALFVLFSFLAPTSASTPSEFISVITGDPVVSRAENSTYLSGNWIAHGDYAFLQSINALTFEGASQAIEQYFLPLNLKAFFLQAGPGRAKTPTTSPTVGFNDFLRAADKYGIAIFIDWTIMGIFGRDHIYWDEDVYKYIPETRNYDFEGEPIDVHPESQYYTNWTNWGRIVSQGTKIDDPRTLEQLKETWKYIYTDLGLGQHPSWVGFWSSLEVPEFKYNSRTEKNEAVGLANHFATSTLENFTNSNQFVNHAGCKLYEKFIARTASYPTYPDLFDDIRLYHWDNNVWTTKTGFTRWLEDQSLKFTNDFIGWFENYTGKRWIWWEEFFQPYMIREIGSDRILASDNGGTIAGGPFAPTTPTQVDPNYFYGDTEEKLKKILQSPTHTATPWSMWGARNDNSEATTPEEMRDFVYLQQIPLLAQPLTIFDIDGYYIKDNTKLQWAKYFGSVLSRMRYYGGWFGSEKKACRVLAIGRQEAGITPQFFTPVCDVYWFVNDKDHENESLLLNQVDNNLFDVIVIWSGPDVSSTEVRDKIKNFVSNGGGLVVNSIPSWASDVFVNSVAIDTSHVIYKPFTSVTGYGLTIREGTYGAGRVVHIPFTSQLSKIGAPNLDASTGGGKPKDDFIVLLSNALLYTAKKESLIPAFYYSTTYNRIYPWGNVTYSINGRSGEPVLFWLSNPDNTANTIEVNLNANFYGINPDGWIIWDANSGEVVSTGSGNNIKINLTVPAKSWKPLYIFNSSDAYSNVFITAKSSLSNQDRFTLKGPYKQPKWLVYSSTQRPSAVRAGTLTLNPVSSVSGLLTSNGWYHDDVNAVVYVRYVE